MCEGNNEGEWGQAKEGMGAPGQIDWPIEMKSVKSTGYHPCLFPVQLVAGKNNEAIILFIFKICTKATCRNTNITEFTIREFNNLIKLFLVFSFIFFTKFL